MFTFCWKKKNKKKRTPYLKLKMVPFWKDSSTFAAGLSVNNSQAYFWLNSFCIIHTHYFCSNLIWQEVSTLMDELVSSFDQMISAHPWDMIQYSRSSHYIYDIFIIYLISHFFFFFIILILYRNAPSTGIAFSIDVISPADVIVLVPLHKKSLEMSLQNQGNGIS